MLPLKYERRFLSPAYIASKIAAGRRRDWYQLLSSPVYYLLRVRVFLKYWAMTIRGIRFDGPWLRGQSVSVRAKAHE